MASGQQTAAAAGKNFTRRSRAPEPSPAEVPRAEVRPDPEPEPPGGSRGLRLFK